MKERSSSQEELLFCFPVGLELESARQESATSRQNLPSKPDTGADSRFVSLKVFDGTPVAKESPVMNLVETLQQHFLLCEEIHLLLLEENRILQTTRRPPGKDFLTRKGKLLPRLDTALLALGISRATETTGITLQKAAIERLQKKMLSLLLLDRENEKLLLKCSVQADAFRVAAKPRAHLVARAYTAAAA
jgi:hypothetical protein